MAQEFSIAVIGAGLMGHGIALTLARAGHRVTLTDPVEAARAAARDRIGDSLRLLGADAAEVTAVLGRVQVAGGVAAAVAGVDVVFEAAPEKLPLKQALFAEIEAAAPAGAILASNTSALPITAIMAGLRDGSRALGTHWWNPPHLIPLVEVIRTPATTEATVAATVALLAGAGKTPVRVEKDVPGFIGNRLQHALWREAISLVEQGICDAEAVDTVVKASFGRRLAVLPALLNPSATGPVVREAQRHLAQLVLQPIADQLAEEASAKLGGRIALDVVRPMQAFDHGGKARAFGAMLAAYAAAKDAGLDPATIEDAKQLIDWQEDPQ